MAKDTERPIHQEGDPGHTLPLSSEVLLHTLHHLASEPCADPAALYAECLSAGRKLLGVGSGMLGRIEGDNYRILALQPDAGPLAQGKCLSLTDLYCHRVVYEGCTQAVGRAGRHFSFNEYPLLQNAGVEAYLGTPVWVDGEVYGTLSFFDNHARDGGFDGQLIEFVELMAWGLGRILERRELEHRCSRALQKLQENIDLFENAFQFAPIGKALVAPSGRLLRVNRAFANMLGYSEAELISSNFQAITHPDDLDVDLALLQETLDGKRDGYHLEKRYLHRDGSVVWALLSVSLVRRESGSPRYFVSQIQDITHQKQVMDALHRKRRELELTNQELQSLATKDPLTQLFNRRGFFERFHEELHKCARSKQPLSLLILDVDHFKSYNDTFGHPAGDVALQKIADVLRSSGRIHDVVARHGGEEFAIILPGTDVAGSWQIAERVREAVASIEDDDVKRRLTISIGGATTMAEDVDGAADRLLRHADKALYAAKAAGRNRMHHASETPVGEGNR